MAPVAPGLTRPLRLAIVLAIVGLIGGVFVYREVVGGALSAPEGSLGVIDADRRAVVGELASDFHLEVPGSVVSPLESA
jgi:hypothetical protein